MTQNLVTSKLMAGALILVLVYVDNILITGASSSQILDIIQLLNAKFALKHPGPGELFSGVGSY